MMELTDKVYIAGHRGLVGSAIVRQLKARGFTNLLMRTHKELDLTNQLQVQAFFQQEKPDYVIHLAAYVGGLYKNIKHKVDMLEINLMCL